MVQILEDNSFGSQMGKALTGGAMRGYEREKKFAHELALQDRKKKQEDVGLKDRGRESIQHMKDIIGRGKTGWNFLNYLTPEGRRDRGALDTAALNLERLAVEMQGKGALNRQRFEYMKDRLPSSGKSDDENLSILDEWERILSEDETEQENGSKKSDKSSKEKFLTMRDPSGALRKVSSKEVNKAKKHGYKVIK